MSSARWRVTAEVKTRLQDELVVCESVTRSAHLLLADEEETNWSHVRSRRREYTFCWRTKRSLRSASNSVLSWYNSRT